MILLKDSNLMNDVLAVGGKGIGLKKLADYGLNVPEFFVITAGTDIFDDNFAAELDGFAANLHCDLFAVRSSSVNEDGANGSFAGQYTTLLDVTREKLLEAVRTVASSSSNKTVENYNEHFGKQAASVAVVVQRQLHGEYSGVMFTTSPYDSDSVIIESVSGACENLVSGVVVPEEIVLNKNSECAPHGFYKELFDTAKILETGEGYALDIEWTFACGRLWILQMRPLTAIGDAIPSIADKKWNMYVYRDFCHLAHGVQCMASSPAVQAKLFGFAVPISEGLIVNGREFYSEENDVKTNKIWKSLDEDGFFDAFIAKIKKLVKNTRMRVDRLKKIDCNVLDTKQLFKLYKREIKAYIDSYTPLMMRPDDYLFSKLIDAVGQERAENLSSIASISNKKTYYSEERIKFLNAIISGDASRYLSEYEWIISPLGRVAETITKERFLKRANETSLLEAKRKLRALKASRQSDVRDKNAVIASLSENECKLFELISEFIYLRTYTSENSDRYFYYIRKIVLENICKRLNITEETLLLMSIEEISMAENGFRLTAREISKRKSGEIIVISNGECQAYYSGKSYALLKKLLPVKSQDNAILKGRVACMGEVYARVKIVNNLSQADNFEQGCILVTTMTVPEITPALDKACGIITDEGGITCHAAIIAREYAVPCLVGTKNATTVLRDGMYVKLDCVNGVVVIDEESRK